jgi:hypothetical protein
VKRDTTLFLLFEVRFEARFFSSKPQLILEEFRPGELERFTACARKRGLHHHKDRDESESSSDHLLTGGKEEVKKVTGGLTHPFDFSGESAGR